MPGCDYAIGMFYEPEIKGCWDVVGQYANGPSCEDGVHETAFALRMGLRAAKYKAEEWERELIGEAS